MNAISELKAMLDERGVKHRDNIYSCNTQWESLKGGAAHASQCKYDESLLELTAYTVTPQQAIDATLGRGECQECHATEQNYKRCKYSTDRGWCDDECELHDCEGSFSAVNKPVWRCDCGAFMTQYTDATTYHKPRYCPNCGRRVRR